MDSSHRRFGIWLCSCLGLVTVVVGLVGGGLFSGCGPASRKDLPAGRLKIVMGKTPLPSQPLKAAAVTITRIEVLRDRRPAVQAGIIAEVPGAIDSVESPEDSWIVVQEGEQTLNLLELRNGQISLLTNSDIPEGRYRGLRLSCKEGRVTIGKPRPGTTDRTFVLEVPRGRNPDIRLECEFAVAAGRETALLLRVDADRAFSPILGSRIGDVDEISGFRFEPWAAMGLANLLTGGPSIKTTGTEPNLPPT
jgi:hypothetical protein